MVEKNAQQIVEQVCTWMPQAAAIAMRYYEEPAGEGEVFTKNDESPLTRADLEVDALLHEELQAAFPDVPIVTEERAASHEIDAARFFLVDPIDGTKEFIHRRGDFTINIALVEDGSPVAGIVCAPALGKLYRGVVGGGAMLSAIDGKDAIAIAVSTPDNSALRVIASRSHLTEETRTFIEANAIGESRNAGSSLKFCVLAEGDADLYPRFGPTMEWDTAAGDAVLRAAGGFVRRLNGEPMTYGKQSFKNGWFVAGAGGATYQVPDALTHAAVERGLM